jgi:hypothetical protein
MNNYSFDSSFRSLFWGVLILFSCFALAGAESSQTAWVIFQARSDGDLRPAARARLRMADEIRTTSTTEAEIFFGRQAWVHLMPQSTLRVVELQPGEQGAGSTALRLMSGQAVVRTEPKSQGLRASFLLSSGTVQTYTSDRSLFALVEKPGQEPEVAVGEGAVQVTVAGSTATLTSDQALIVSPASAPPAPGTPSDSARQLLKDRKKISFRSAYEIVEQIEDPSAPRSAEGKNERSFDEFNGPVEEGRPSGEAFPKNEENIEP